MRERIGGNGGIRPLFAPFIREASENCKEGIMKDDMLPHDKVRDGLDIEKFRSLRSGRGFTEGRS